MEPKGHTIGYKSVLTALSGNVLVGLVKFTAFLFTGSGVLLSESIHSIADSTNQVFLLLGIVRSKKPADEDFNYGYQSERFFWSLLSACGVFFLGAGATIYHGVTTLLHHETIEISLWSIGALLFASILEGLALSTAIREAKMLSGKEKLLDYYKYSGDPTLMAIIYEDSAAIIGIVIALLSMALTKITGQTYWDSIGSLLIGSLLGVVAVLLININRKLLLGKSVPPHIRKKIFTVLHSQKIVDEVHDFKTVMVTTDGYRVKAEIEVNGHYLADKIFESRDFKREYAAIKDYEDFVRFCADYSDEVSRTLGREIDRIEAEVASEVPMVKYIDIEAN